VQKIKFKSFVLIIPILIFSGISFYFFSLIFSTLKFDVSKNKKSRESKYSYVISSSDNKILSKLSRKFEIDNSYHKIPFLLKASVRFISVDCVFNCEDKKFDNCLSRFEELELILLSISLNFSKLFEILV